MNIIKAVKLAYEYKRYGEDGQVEETLRAVDGVDLDVKKGDFVAILGHNGSGKSTLAKQINALLVPTEGTLMWTEWIRRIRKRSGISVRVPVWFFRIQTTRSLALWWMKM